MAILAWRLFRARIHRRIFPLRSSSPPPPEPSFLYSLFLHPETCQSSLSQNFFGDPILKLSILDPPPPPSVPLASVFTCYFVSVERIFSSLLNSIGMPACLSPPPARTHLPFAVPFFSFSLPHFFSLPSPPLSLPFFSPPPPPFFPPPPHPPFLPSFSSSFPPIFSLTPPPSFPPSSPLCQRRIIFGPHFFPH